MFPRTEPPFLPTPLSRSDADGCRHVSAVSASFSASFLTARRNTAYLTASVTINSTNHPLTGSRVLVTGASGFIGGHLMKRLAALGAVTHGVSRNAPAGGLPGAAFHALDLADAAGTARVFAEVRPDFVFHLASHVAGSRTRELVMPTFRDNLISTVNLLMAAAATPCKRFILTGSLEEPESASEAPSSPYAAAKASARLYADMFHALYSVPVVKARLFMVYGPAQRDERKLVPYVIRCLLAGESPRLSSGQRPVDWVFVEDVVDGLIAMACAARPIEGKRLDLGSGSLVTVRAVVERLVALVNAKATPEFGALGERPFEQVRQADAAGTLAETGWSATVSLEEGLSRTVEWYRTHSA